MVRKFGMIKKFKIFEEISWWKDGDLSDDEDIINGELKIGDKLICQVDYTVGCYPTTHIYKKGNEYEIVDIDYDRNRICMMSDTGKSHWVNNDGHNFDKNPPPFQRVYVPISRGRQF